MFTHFFFLLGLVCFAAAEQKTPDHIYIVNGTSNVLFAKSADAKESIIIKPQNKHLISLPFIQSKRYLFELIMDKPYIPQEALLVKLSKTYWYIWRDEQSVRYIKIIDGEPQSREDKLPKPLISIAHLTGVLCAEFSGDGICVCK